MAEQTGVYSQDDLFAKVIKLMELAERAGTPDEAAAAVARINTLVLKANLDLAEIARQRSDANAAPEYVHEMWDVDDSTAHIRFRIDLLNTIAYYHFCKSIFTTRRKGPTTYLLKLHLVGQKHNVQIVRYIFDHLYTEMKRMAKSGWKQYYGPVSRVAFLNSFSAGFQHAIAYRLDQDRGDMVRPKQLNPAPEVAAQAKATQALIVLTDAQLKEATARFFETLRQRRNVGIDIADHAAYRQGRNAGNAVSMNKAITGGN